MTNVKLIDNKFGEDYEIITKFSLKMFLKKFFCENEIVKILKKIENYERYEVIKHDCYIGVVRDTQRKYYVYFK